MPSTFLSSIRQVVRDILLEKEKLPTIHEVYRRISKLTVSDVLPLRLSEDTVAPLETSVWSWSKATLHGFMLSTVCLNMKSVMRDNFLEWVQYYRDQEYDVLYQNAT